MNKCTSEVNTIPQRNENILYTQQEHFHDK